MLKLNHIVSLNNESIAVTKEQAEQAIVRVISTFIFDTDTAQDTIAEHKWELEMEGATSLFNPTTAEYLTIENLSCTELY